MCCPSPRHRPTDKLISITSARLTIDEINALDQEAFVAALGSLFEGSPWIAAEAWRLRPFESIAHLHRALCDVLYHASPEQQVALLRAHPDLVGKAALAGTLTPESTREQALAGLDRLSPEEITKISYLRLLDKVATED